MEKTQEMGHIYALAADDPDSQVSKEDIELMQKLYNFYD